MRDISGIEMKGSLQMACRLIQFSCPTRQRPLSNQRTLDSAGQHDHYVVRRRIEPVRPVLLMVLASSRCCGGGGSSKRARCRTAPSASRCASCTTDVTTTVASRRSSASASSGRACTMAAVRAQRRASPANPIATDGQERPACRAGRTGSRACPAPARTQGPARS